MQNRRITPQNLLITIFSFALITGLSAVIQDNIIGAGVSDTVKEIHRFIEGWNTFFSRLSAVTSLLGFKTLMLFLAVLIISSGLAAIGIPRGKVSFLAALLLCNLVWIAFKDSFNPGNIAYLGPILRANLTLCMPLILLNGGSFAFKKIRSRLAERNKGEPLLMRRRS